LHHAENAVTAQGGKPVGKVQLFRPDALAAVPVENQKPVAGPDPKGFMGIFKQDMNKIIGKEVPPFMP